MALESQNLEKNSTNCAEQSDNHIFKAAYTGQQDGVPSEREQKHHLSGVPELRIIGSSSPANNVMDHEANPSRVPEVTIVEEKPSSRTNRGDQTTLPVSGSRSELPDPPKSELPELPKSELPDPPKEPLRPQDSREDEALKRIVDEIIKTGKIPQELKEVLDAKQSPDGRVLDIDRLNRMLAERGSHLNIDFSYGTDGQKTMTLRDKENAQVLDQAKSSQSDKQLADHQKEEAAQLKQLAEDMIKTGKIPESLRLALQHELKAGEKGLDIEALNKLLKAMGSNLMLKFQSTADGLKILELCDASTNEVKDLVWGQSQAHNNNGRNPSSEPSSNPSSKPSSKPSRSPWTTVPGNLGVTHDPVSEPPGDSWIKALNNNNFLQNYKEYFQTTQH